MTNSSLVRDSPLNGVTNPENKTLSAEKLRQLPAAFPEGCKVGAQRDNPHCTAVFGSHHGQVRGHQHLLLMVTRTLHAT